MEAQSVRTNELSTSFPLFSLRKCTTTTVDRAFCYDSFHTKVKKVDIPGNCQTERQIVSRRAQREACGLA